MSALDYLAALLDRGFRVRVRSGSLLVRPASELSDEDRAALTRHKPALIAILEGRSPLARFHFVDADARPCAPNQSHMWTWEGAPRWYYASDTR